MAAHIETHVERLVEARLAPEGFSPGLTPFALGGRRGPRHSLRKYFDFFAIMVIMMVFRRLDRFSGELIRSIRSLPRFTSLEFSAGELGRITV